MIPKIIHYCWFGGKPLPNDVINYIESWKQFCPDYEIKQWDESNFNLEICNYVKEAYEAKKWAFITDYVRLYVMVNEGGIYMDTDVEVIKSLDPFLDNKAFSGFEDGHFVPTGIMACEKGFPLFEEMLHFYDNKHFLNEDGTYDLTTNVITITDICLKHGLKTNNMFQVIDGFSLYPKEYFCPKDYITGELHITDNTVTIHHFSGSWETKAAKISRKIRVWFKKHKCEILGVIVAFPWSFMDKICIKGFKKTISFYYKKYLLGKKVDI